MGATVQWLRHRIVFLLGREAEVRDHAEHNAPPRRENDTGAARPTAHEIEANERDRAERFSPNSPDAHVCEWRVLGQHRYEAADAAVTSEAGEEG